MISIKNNQAGQSLMEMLIAIFILIVALTATIVLVVTSINAGRDSINKLIATNLAREGVEVVRNIRDGNWIEPTNTEAWDAGLDIGPVVVPIIVPFNLIADSISMDTATDFNDQKAQIYFSEANNFYYQKTVSPAEDQVNFYRLIYLNNICHDSNNNEMIAEIGNADNCGAGDYTGYDDKVGIRVVSEVRWPNPTSGRKVQVEERLYNWQRL